MKYYATFVFVSNEQLKMGEHQWVHMVIEDDHLDVFLDILLDVSYIVNSL